MEVLDRVPILWVTWIPKFAFEELINPLCCLCVSSLEFVDISPYCRRPFFRMTPKGIVPRIRNWPNKVPNEAFLSDSPWDVKETGAPHHAQHQLELIYSFLLGWHFRLDLP